MSARPWTLKRLLGFFAWQTALAVPFGVFFNLLYGDGFKTFLPFYAVSLLFAYVIGVAVVANRVWALPLIVRIVRPEGRSALAVEIGSFAFASMLGAIVAGVIINATVAHGQLASAHGIATFLAFTVIFCGLFLGWIYAVRFQRRYAERIRAEAEANAREEQELRIAGEIQRGLQPGRPHATRSFAAAGAAIACRTIGGDFFDYFDLPGGRLGFA
ncbi:MAG TPA: hypothetical protein VGK76_07610, partial [Candidatus Eisenbacteria bacterium]